jgi:hypothetical protein
MSKLSRIGCRAAQWFAGLIALAAAGCAKPEIPKDWQDVIPEVGMKKVGDEWVKVYPGGPQDVGLHPKEYPRVLSVDAARGFGSANSGGNHVDVWYDNSKVTADALQKAFEAKISDAGYKSLLDCSDSNAILATKGTNDVVAVTIESLTTGSLEVSVWKVKGAVLDFPEGANCKWSKVAFGEEDGKGFCEWGHGQMCVLRDKH